MLERPGRYFVEADLSQQPQPLGPTEQTALVAVVRPARGLPLLVQQVRKVDQVRAIRRARIEGPLEIAQCAASTVVAAVVGARFEQFANVVRCEQRHAAPTTVDE